MAADTDDALYEWSSTESNNKPSGPTTVGTNWDDNLRMIQKVVRGWLASKGADIASATTTDIGAVEGLFHDITGTTTITSFGTVSAGIWKILKFEGAVTITHNATSLITPTGANITTANGDMCKVTSEGSGNWRMNWFVKAGREIVNVKYFGAVGDATADDTTAIQNAINALTGAATIGGILFFPPGFYKTTAALTITKGIIVRGSGFGSGSGVGNAGGTVIRSAAAAGDVFTVSCDEAVIFEDLTIDAPSVTKASGTAGIRLQGAGGAGTTGRRFRLERMRILNMFDGVVWDTAADVVVHACHIQDFLNTGIYSKQTSGTDTGQSIIHGCVIWDLNVGTAQACIRYDKGGDLRIIGNKILGATYGFRLALDAGPTGTIIFNGNSVEEQTGFCMKIEQITTATDFANLTITGNQFSILSGTPQGGISIAAGTPSAQSKWIQNIVIGHNVFNMAYTAAVPCISVQDGEGVDVSHNVITHRGNSGPTAITTAAAAISCTVHENKIIDTPSGKYASGIGAGTILHDSDGLTVANLPSSANGSRVYVTDGKRGTDPVAASGSGVFACRVNGAWNAEDSIPTATASTSGTLLNATDITITLNARAFFPMIQMDGAIAGQAAMQGAITAGTFDEPRFRLRNDSGVNKNYDVRHRYMTQ